MKAIFLILKRRNPKTAKSIFFLILLILYPIIYGTGNRFLSGRYNYSNMLYINRLLFFVLICILLVYVRLVFHKFIREDWECLVLFGLDFPQRFILFSLTHYEIFFLQIYFGTMIAQAQGISIVHSVFANVFTALLIELFGIWISLHTHSKLLTSFTFTMIGLLGILVGTKKLSFKMVYTIVMSESITGFLFPQSMISISIRIIISICLLLYFSHRYQSICLDKIIARNHANRMHIMGELNHWLNGHLVYGKNYIWMYRNKDFILWKIFSAIIFIVFCYTESGSIILFLLAYGICLISSLYFKDIYNFETTLLLPYYMSNYAYTSLFRDQILSGFFLLGDNIFLIVLIDCIFHPQNIIILPVLALTLLFVASFISSHLFKKFPAKQYYLSVCVALIQLHLPVLNLYFLYKNIDKGKRNWENLHYE